MDAGKVGTRVSMKRVVKKGRDVPKVDDVYEPGSYDLMLRAKREATAGSPWETILLLRYSSERVRGHQRHYRLPMI
ncbi:MAG TPA: hypothetical protein VIH67_12455 [Candidatus Acidoferrum sp.]